jgi:hypothetical protein
MKLTGAAILVSRDMKVWQAAPAAYPNRSLPSIPMETRLPADKMDAVRRASSASA